MLLVKKLITFEGADGVGKTLFSSKLVKDLEQLGFRVAYFASNNKRSFISKYIKEWLANKNAIKYPKTFQLLNFINQFIFSIKLPLIQKNYDFIIADRFSLSFLVYGSLTTNYFYVINLLSKLFVRPKKVFLIDGNSLNFNRNYNDCYDGNREFQEKIRKEFLLHTLEDCRNVILISNNGDKSVEEISKQVLSYTCN